MNCGAETCEREATHHGWCGMHWQRVKRNGAPVLQTERPRKDPTVRFWKKVDQSGGPEACWPWQAGRMATGYGLFRLEQLPATMKKAHRVSWLFAYGEIPEGMHVCHRCDNPPCVNPAHLFLDTREGNMRDRDAKGRVHRGMKHHGESSGRSAKLTLAQVTEIKRAYAAREASQAKLGKRFGVSQTQVGRIVRGERWAHD
jgi:hypothetical protein